MYWGNVVKSTAESFIVAESLILAELHDLSICRRIVEESLELYTCKPGPDSEFPGDPGFNITAPRSYNELATLMSVPGIFIIPCSSGTHVDKSFTL